MRDFLGGVTATATFGQHATVPSIVQYIPPDAVIWARIQVDSLLQNELFRLIPVEVLRLTVKERYGCDVTDFETVDIIAGVPMPTGPQVAALISLRKPVDSAKLNLVSPIPANRFGDIWDNAFYLGNPKESQHVHLIDSKHILLGPKSYVLRLLNTKLAAGDRRSSAEKFSGISGHVSVVMAVEPVRELLQGLAASRVPPAFAADLQTVAAKCKVVMARLQLDQNFTLDIAVDGNTSKDVGELERSFTNLGKAADRWFKAETNKVFAGTASRERVYRAYCERISELALTSLLPRRSGDRLLLRFEASPLNVLQLQLLTIAVLPTAQRISFGYSEGAF